MAPFNLKSNSNQHVRSISLPSRPQPLTPQVDEHLSRLRDSEATSSSLSSISHKLKIVEDMYESLDELLQLPNTQQVFAKNEKVVEEILDGYLRLLDLCATAKNLSSLAKQDIQSIQSVLRRRRDENELERCFNSRKQTKKLIQRSLKDLKNIRAKHNSTDNEAISSMFLKVEEASFKALETLILYIAGSKPQSKLSVFVNKRIFKKTLSPKDEVNEFEKVDTAFEVLLKKMTESFEDTEKIVNVQNQLAEMGSTVEDLEQGLECLFRRLIKSRVALLNILNH